MSAIIYLTWDVMNEPPPFPQYLLVKSDDASVGDLNDDFFTTLTSMEQCNGNNDEPMLPGNYCDWFWDDHVCWPATPFNTTVTLPCPPETGYDASKMVSKYCGPDGFWRRYGTDDEEEYWHSQASAGECLSREIRKILEQINHLPAGGIQIRFLITKVITVLELIGLTFSMILVLGCFIIFYFFRKIRNDRTRIHMHLLGAVLCSVIMKLVIIVDQLATGKNMNSTRKSGFHSLPVLCESIYVLLEYSKSSMYMWMFVEALHLYRASAVTATPMSFRNLYLLIGWGIPGMFVSLWAIAMSSTNHGYCWFGYNYNTWFWILEGPRIITLIINTYYLIRILIVVFIQVSRHASNEMEQVRKTAKATVALLPLLGITHYLTYAEPSIDGALWYFIFYCLVSYFLTSFHGTFVSLMYFLLTEEVKKVIMRRMKSISLDNTNENRDPRKSPKQNTNEEGICRESSCQDIENIDIIVSRV